ncbi:MAG: nucleoside phosphorylase [Bacilli bacterium]|jgi:uridine phosphorylase|nr:nucleoside phosphorylase [Bacilli bacterium]
MQPTLYLKVTDQSVAPYVIFSGDPWRVEVLKSYLDNPQSVGFYREFNTYTGTYKGLPITITSTGIGAPSAVIALEEMFDAGMKVALRMGTSMSLSKADLGNYIIPSSSKRLEKTSLTYVSEDYPAKADSKFLQSIIKTVTSQGQKVITGESATMDGYYSQMKESRLSKMRQVDIEKNFAQLEQEGIISVDMETSALMVVASLMKVPFASLTLVTVLKNLSALLDEKTRRRKEDELCRLALDSMVNFVKEEKINE